MKLEINNIDFDVSDDTDEFEEDITEGDFDAQSGLFDEGIGDTDFNMGDTEPSQHMIDLDKVDTGYSGAEDFMTDDVDIEPNDEGINRSRFGFPSKLNMSETKKTALLSIGVGLAFLILILIVINITVKVRNKNNSAGYAGETGTLTVSTESNLDTSTDTAVTPIQAEETSVGVWIPVTETINLKTTKTGRFTVNEIQSYGTAVGENLEVKTVAVGELLGYGNGYEIIIPNQLAASTKIGSMLTVTYKTGVIGSTVVIGDIKPITDE